MYDLQYSLSDEDYIQYNITHQFSTPALRRRLQTYRFAFAAFYAVIALLFIFVFRRNTFRVIFGVLFAAMACLYLFGTTWRVKRNIRRSIEKTKRIGKLPYPANIHIRFNDEEIDIVTDDSQEKTVYSVVERMIIGDDAFYIYRASISAFIIPFRAFETMQQREAFLAFIEGKAHVKAVKGRTN